MKNKINSTLHDRSKLIKPSAGGNGAMGTEVWKLGLDVDLRNIAVAIQRGRGLIGPARKFNPRAAHRVGEAEGGAGSGGAHGI